MDGSEVVIFAPGARQQHSAASTGDRKPESKYTSHRYRRHVSCGSHGTTMGRADAFLIPHLPNTKESVTALSAHGYAGVLIGTDINMHLSLCSTREPILNGAVIGAPIGSFYRPFPPSHRMVGGEGRGALYSSPLSLCFCVYAANDSRCCPLFTANRSLCTVFPQPFCERRLGLCSALDKLFSPSCDLHVLPLC